MKKNLIFLIFTLININVFAQDWEYFDKDNSPLVDNTVKDIAIDPVTGDKWIAAGDEVYHISGDTWTTYTQAEGLIHGALSIETKDGIVWVGHAEGVSRFDGNEWAHFDDIIASFPGDFSYPYIKAIEFDQNDNVWFGVGGKGLFKYDGNTWTNYNSDNTNLPEDDFIVSISIDQQNNQVWVGGSCGQSGGNVHVMDINSAVWTTYDLETLPCLSAVQTGSNGKVWIGSCGDSGVTTLQNGIVTNALETDCIAMDAIDNDPSNPNRVWMGTFWDVQQYSGLLLYDGNEIVEHYNNSNSPMKGESVLGLAVETLGEGNYKVWMVASDKIETYMYSVDVGNPPSEIHLSNNTIDENIQAGALIGTFTTTDPDADDAHTYSLVDGEGDTDNAHFSINNNELLTVSVFDYESQQNYQIRIRTTDSGGNTFEKQFPILVNDIITNIHEQKESDKIKLFPNPANSTITIRASNLQPGKKAITLYNYQGKKVIQKRFIHQGKDFQGRINIDKLPQGTYLLMITDNVKNKEIHSRQFIKK